MSGNDSLTIQIPLLARVEGEGALDLALCDGRVSEVKLRIFEPPRLFEKLLEGRAWHEVPDLVARICGICPAAYQLTAVSALESLFGIDPGPWVSDMRQLFYCGEWIESHALHIHLLAAPDFLGCNNVIELAARDPQAVRRGLRLQALGNDILSLLGGRSVHPVGVRVGGFCHAPGDAEVRALAVRIREAMDDAMALLHWTADLPLPDSRQDFNCVALGQADAYPMLHGRLISSHGLDIDQRDFESHFMEHQVPHSTALHCLLQGRPYLVGPLARLNLNYHLLPETIQQALQDTGITWPSLNMFHSIVARAVEILFALGEALKLLEHYRPPSQVQQKVQPRAGIAMACTEAPRGILWQRYQVSEDGLIQRVRIVPPTSQNQARIEQDLTFTLSGQLPETEQDRLHAQLRGLSESVIRNYDPCISCATHFLDLRIHRQ